MTDETLKEALNSSLSASFRGAFISELATLEEQLVDSGEDAHRIDLKSKDIVDLYEDSSKPPAIKNVEILQQLIELMRSLGLEIPTTDAVSLHKQKIIGDILDKILVTEDSILSNVLFLLFAEQTGLEGGLVKVEGYVY